MWVSADRVVHVVAMPSDSRVLQPLRELLAAYSTEQLSALDQQLSDLQFSVADQLDAERYAPETEKAFEGRCIPADLVEAMDWSRLLSADLEAELDLLDLRWRLDVIGIISQMIADEG